MRNTFLWISEQITAANGRGSAARRRKKLSATKKKTNLNDSEADREMIATLRSFRNYIYFMRQGSYCSSVFTANSTTPSN